MNRHEVMFKKIAVVIPCYNEAASIAEVISKFPHDALQQHFLQLKVYVVDNNSTDSTAKIARQAGAVVLYEGEKGKGNALRTGFRSLPEDIDYVVMLDGDDTYSPEEILRIVEPLRSNFCDVVVGSRLGGHIKTAAMSRLNRFGNQVFTAGVRLLYGANVTDVLTGYFAWKKPVLDVLTPHIKSSGFAIEMEMITKMARLGFQMAAVPISYHPRAGESNLRPFKDGLRILLMLLKNIIWQPGAATKALKENRKLISRKIVFVSDAIYPYMIGGKEKRLHEISKHLAAMGHDVHIYTMHWWNEPQKIKIESGVQLHALCKHYNLYHGDRRSITEGIAFGLACFKLWRVSFDVLDVDHMPFFPIFSAWIVCLLRRRKLYATWHETLSHQEWVKYMGRSGLIAALVERLSIRLPYCITAASAQTQQLLAANHGRNNRVELVASGIDTSLLQKVRPAAVQCDVLYVGRLVKDKHVNTLILAINIIAKTDPGIRCLIVGQGVEKPSLQRLTAQHGLQENIMFLTPFREQTTVYAYMKAAKVFCSPSIREGFGITTLEALGCGTPVVTTNCPGNAARHLIQPSQTGSVVPLKPIALAEALSHWVSVTQKPVIAKQVAQWDWRQLAEKQAEVYTL